MPDPLRVGVIGPASSYTLFFSEAFHAMEDVDFVGIANLDRDPKYIQASLNLFWLSRFPKTVEGYQQAWGGGIYEKAVDMFEQAKPDAVCICTEDYLRQHYATMALERGIHVFLPKPFATSREEAEQVFAMANAKDLTCVGSLPMRFRGPSAAASDLIDAGAIGRPLMGHFPITHHLTFGGWKSDTSMAAGPEFEMGFYTLDLVRMLMKSEPKAVSAIAANLDHRGVPFIDNAKAMIQCVNGAMASVDFLFSMHQPFPTGRVFYVVGDEGALVPDTDPESGSPAIEVHTPDGVTYHPVDPAHGYGPELTNWLDLCRGKGDVAWWQDQALRTLDLIVAFKQAYQLGGTVDLLPDDCCDE